MLIRECEVTNMYIKVNGFMVGRPVSETKTINPFIWSHKMKFLACPITKITNLLTTRSLYLIIYYQHNSKITIDSFYGGAQGIKPDKFYKSSNFINIVFSPTYYMSHSIDTNPIITIFLLTTPVIYQYSMT
jgi:hypothetical protein